jgi:hypothetical protein
MAFGLSSWEVEKSTSSLGGIAPIDVLAPRNFFALIYWPLGGSKIAFLLSMGITTAAARWSNLVPLFGVESWRSHDAHALAADTTSEVVLT